MAEFEHGQWVVDATGVAYQRCDPYRCHHMPLNLANGYPWWCPQDNDHCVDSTPTQPLTPLLTPLLTPEQAEAERRQATARALREAAHEIRVIKAAQFNDYAMRTVAESIAEWLDDRAAEVKAARPAETEEPRALPTVGERQAAAQWLQNAAEWWAQNPGDSGSVVPWLLSLADRAGGEWWDSMPSRHRSTQPVDVSGVVEAVRTLTQPASTTLPESLGYGGGDPELADDITRDMDARWDDNGPGNNAVDPIDAIGWILVTKLCRCDEAFIARGRHETSSPCYWVEDILDALAEIGPAEVSGTDSEGDAVRAMKAEHPEWFGESASERQAAALRAELAEVTKSTLAWREYVLAQRDELAAKLVGIRRLCDESDMTGADCIDTREIRAVLAGLSGGDTPPADSGTGGEGERGDQT